MRLVALAAALALAHAPAWGQPAAAQPLAAGEVQLEVNALGSVSAPADRATFTASFVAQGRSEAAARAAIETKLSEARTALLGLGVAEADIQSGAINVSGEPAMPPGLPAPAEATASPFVGQAQLTVVVRDAGRTNAARQVLERHAVFAMPTYALANSDRQRAEARVEAVRRARADAEAYAGALRMRVARISRVTERIGLDVLPMALSDPGIIRLFGPSAGQGGATVNVVVIVGVDFVLAPR